MNLENVTNTHCNSILWNEKSTLTKTVGYFTIFLEQKVWLQLCKMSGALNGEWKHDKVSQMSYWIYTYLISNTLILVHVTVLKYLYLICIRKLWKIWYIYFSVFLTFHISCFIARKKSIMYAHCKVRSKAYIRIIRWTLQFTYCIIY